MDMDKIYEEKIKLIRSINKIINENSITGVMVNNDNTINNIFIKTSTDIKFRLELRIIKELDIIDNITLYNKFTTLLDKKPESIKIDILSKLIYFVDKDKFINLLDKFIEELNEDYKSLKISIIDYKKEIIKINKFEIDFINNLNNNLLQSYLLAIIKGREELKDAI